MERKKWLFRILVLGDEGVGKTTLVTSLIAEQFVAQTKGVIGGTLLYDENGKQLETIDGETGGYFYTKDISVEQNIVTLQFSIPTEYITSRKESMKDFLRAHLSVVCYDWYDCESFSNLSKWITFVRRDSKMDEPRPIVLVACKGDLSRAIPEETVKSFTADNQCLFHAVTSAKTLLNVKEFFHRIATACREHQYPFC